MGSYVEAEVMQGLGSRGLYERQAQPGFWKITHTGEVARTKFERVLATLGRERLSLWVDDEPTQALAFLGVANSSPLLIEELHPDLRRLHDRHQTGASAYLSAEGGVAGDDIEAV